jgi:hypothetical protein
MQDSGLSIVYSYFRIAIDIITLCIYLYYTNNFILIYFFFNDYEKILIRLDTILIDKYDRDEAAIEDNIAASKGLNPVSNNSNSLIHLDKLLTISNIDHANIIFFITCFRRLKVILLENLLVYFYCYSRS